MLKNYIKRSVMLLGAAAVVTTASADGYVDVTRTYMKETAYLPGWQGVIGAVGEGVGEVWNGAFRLYQNLGEQPAGEYTLTCNAFYRCGSNVFTKENMKSKPELYKAYIFINNDQKKVAGLFDNSDTAPNSLTEANQLSKPANMQTH